MPRSCSRVIAIASAIALILAPLRGPRAYGLEVVVPRKHHPWGQFKPGAWKKVRVSTETFDTAGRLASTSLTETTTTLVEVSDKELTLRIEAVIEVAGRRTALAPEIIKQGFRGEVNGQSSTAKVLGKEKFVVNGREIPCESRQIEATGGGVKRVTTIWYSDQVAPHVLRRRSVATDAESNKVQYETTTEVVALGMPQRVLAEIKTAAHVKTIYTSPQERTVTLEVHCQDVPGGVVSHTSKKTDDTGRLLSRSTLELLDYGLTQPAANTMRPMRRGGLFFRRFRSRRAVQ